MSITSNPKVITLINRVKNLLLTPKAEWEKIDAEPATMQSLFTDYALILAAIPAICGFLGAVLFGYRSFGVTIHFSFMGALSNAVIGYVMSLIGALVMGFVIDFLAPHFQSQKNQISAFKVAIYSCTAAWVAGIFSLIPVFAVFGIVGLYSFYLLNCGLPAVMKTPAEKTLAYTASIVGITLVVIIILRLVMIPFHFMSPGASSMLGSSTMTGQVALPDGSKIDMAEMQKSIRSMQAEAATANNTPPAQPLSVDALKALLPENLPGDFARNKITTGGAAIYTQLNVPTVEGTYLHNYSNITLHLTDLAALPAPARMGLEMGSVGPAGSSETATAYSKTGEVNGRMTVEKYDSTTHQARYAMIISHRIILEVAGSGVTIDDIKAATAAVGPEKIESLLK